MGSIERWLPIPGWEGLYEVSDLGNIRSLSRPRHPGRVLKRTLTRDGYYWRVDLSKDGRQSTRLIHQLVAEAFIGPRPRGLEVCHGPGGSFDNRPVNLSYGTHSENSFDKVRDGTTLRPDQSVWAKLTWEQVAEIRRRAATGGGNGIGAALAREFGVEKKAIYAILHGRTWKNPPTAPA